MILILCGLPKPCQKWVDDLFYFHEVTWNPTNGGGWKLMLSFSILVIFRCKMLIWYHHVRLFIHPNLGDFLSTRSQRNTRCMQTRMSSKCWHFPGSLASQHGCTPCVPAGMRVLGMQLDEGIPLCKVQGNHFYDDWRIRKAFYSLFICVDNITEKHSKRMVISSSLYLSPVKLTWLAGQ